MTRGSTPASTSCQWPATTSTSLASSLRPHLDSILSQQEELRWPRVSLPDLSDAQSAQPQPRRRCAGSRITSALPKGSRQRAAVCPAEDAAQKWLSSAAIGRPIQPRAEASSGVRSRPLIRSVWSGREDLNLRPYRPERYALPSCATPRPRVSVAQDCRMILHGARSGEGRKGPRRQPKRRMRRRCCNQADPWVDQPQTCAGPDA